MITWFRRRKPAPPVNPILVGISRADLLVARWHDLTPEHWNRLSEHSRAQLRDQVVWAVRRPA